MTDRIEEIKQSIERMDKHTRHTMSPDALVVLDEFKDLIAELDRLRADNAFMRSLLGDVMLEKELELARKGKGQGE